MKIKRKYRIYEDYMEEEFLNKQSFLGYNLADYDGKYYTFTEAKAVKNYLVEFFFKELSNYDIKLYEKRGYQLVLTYPSAKSGFYYFFISDKPVEDSDRQLKDRHQLLLNSKHRTDKFSLMILFSSFVFFSYLYFKSQNSLYLILLAMIAIMAFSYGLLYLKIIKRLSEYMKILEMKGRE